MPHFIIERKNSVPESFRTSRVMSMFDMNVNHSNELFEGDLTLPDQWNIGVIYGSSGTGKTTIAKELFHLDDFKISWDDRSILDNMNEKASVDDIVQIFYSVGLGSAPSWLKPYCVLSNGEQMRANLARMLLNYDLIVFDEFTSVVDRQTATTMCLAINKYISKNPNKQIVLISCHEDILHYLNTDWVFNTNSMMMDFHDGNAINSNSPFGSVPDQNGKYLADIII